jgi:Na+:H+ antiporter, NhaA family
MLKRTIRRSTLIVTGHISRILAVLLKDEAVSGKFLLIAAVIALIWVNTPMSAVYESVWSQLFTIGVGPWQLSEDLRHWINEGLMAIFFLVAGLEIKREIIHGELRTFRAASLPIMAAVGGMLIPASLFVLINAGYTGLHGWAITITTDTAFAIGALALLGRRIPTSLRIFLLTAVVVDDIGAIIIIAGLYSHDVAVAPLMIAAGILVCIGVLQWLRLLRLSTFVLLGIGMWLAIHASGVHAAIAGAIVGLSAPVVSRRRDKRAIAGRLERALIPVSTFIVMPLFALANAGVVLSWEAFNGPDAQRVGLGIVVGLVAGKVIGIVGASWLMVRTRAARLPEHITWPMVTGVGLLAGIGFTLSIFIAGLTFESTSLFATAKISICIASLLSVLLGLSVLHWATKRRET